MSYYRKVIRIRAEDSPNVRRELLCQAGVPESEWPSETPGVLTWAEYQQRRQTWDKIRQCVGLDAEFYEGAEILLFPPEWLNRAERLAAALHGKPRRAQAIGCDPGEGGANTAWSVVDEYGLMHLLSMKTPDTSVIRSQTLALMREYNVPAEKVIFDRGGGGKQIADDLRADGHRVQTVAFGEALVLEPRRSMVMVEEKIETKEDRYAYVNRRAEMYGELSLLMDPSRNETGFAIPAEYAELRRQLAPIPKTYDREGRLKLLPKNKNTPGSTEKTLIELLGCSPDEADSLVLAVHGLLDKVKRVVAGAR